MRFQQIKSNRDTQHRWAQFAQHRSHCTRIILRALSVVHPSHEEHSVALFGAGNCNDVDLAQLVQDGSQVWLLDIDAGAVARAAGRAQLGRAVQTLAPIDLLGLYEELSATSKKLLTASEMSLLFQHANTRVRDAIQRNFSVSVSCCLLSQLLDTCARALGKNHPQLSNVAALVVISHLRALLEHTQPGGVAVLLADTQSNESYALDELLAEVGEAQALEQIEQEGSGFTATSREFVRRILSDPAMATLIDLVEFEEPWIWHFSEARRYLVYGVCIHRRK